MTYTDYFLKFDNKAQADAAFLTAGVGVDADGKLPSYTNSAHGGPMAIDILFGTGVKMRPTGGTLTDEKGNTYPEMEPSPGYHVNIRHFGETLPASLAPYALDPDPANPVCVFAG